MCCQNNHFPLQRKIYGNVSRKSLITDTEFPLISNYFPLQTQTLGSKQLNSVTISATMVGSRGKGVEPAGWLWPAVDLRRPGRLASERRSCPAALACNSSTFWRSPHAYPLPLKTWKYPKGTFRKKSTLEFDLSFTLSLKLHETYTGVLLESSNCTYVSYSPRWRVPFRFFQKT